MAVMKDAIRNDVIRSRVGPNMRQELDDLTSGMCRALNDPKRLAILYALAGGSYSVTELCGLLEVSQSNISQHLTVLRDRGLVDTHREGNRVFYSLRDLRVVDAIDLLRSVMNDELSRRQALRHSE